jgi:hypothetical protein
MFQLKNHNGNNKHNSTVTFCPKFRREPHPPEKTIPEFNLDSRYYTNAFVLGTEKRSIAQNSQQDYMSFQTQIKDACEKNNQIVTHTLSSSFPNLTKITPTAPSAKDTTKPITNIFVVKTTKPTSMPHSITTKSRDSAIVIKTYGTVRTSRPTKSSTKCTHRDNSCKKITTKAPTPMNPSKARRTSLRKWRTPRSRSQNPKMWTIMTKYRSNPQRRKTKETALPHHSNSKPQGRGRKPSSRIIKSITPPT